MAQDYVTAYHRAIESGEVTVCAKTRAIYARLAGEIEADEGRWTFDPGRANRPIAFIERFCRHSKGRWAGTPMRLEPWQKAFVSAIFGFVDRETGERRFTEAFLCVARKCGKSTLAAAILLYLYVCEGQADVYTVATKLDQSMLIWEEALHMVEQSPFLRKRIRKRRTDMWLDATKSKFKPLAKNSNTLDGLNGKAFCIDELHALEGPNGRRLYEVCRQAQSAATSPLLLVTTTAGYVRMGVYDDLYGLAASIVDGTIDGEAADRFLPVIYELDQGDDWQDPATWAKANPSLGTVKSYDFLKAEVDRAVANPSDVPGLLTKDFNLPQSGAGYWLQLSEVRNERTFDLRDCAGKWALAGVDLSKCGDLTCATLLMHEGDEILVHQMYWLPSEKVDDHIKGDKIPYDRWHERGLVRYCEGGIVKTEDVTEWFLEMVQRHDISVHSVHYDAWSATRWVDEMQSLGFRMEACHQGAKTLSGPLEHLEADLRAHRVNYGNNPMLTWCLCNATTETDRNGNRLLSKAMSRQRIDGAAALLDAYVGLDKYQSEFMQLT